jgi:hypothetical protein
MLKKLGLSKTVVRAYEIDIVPKICVILGIIFENEKHLLF